MSKPARLLFVDDEPMVLNTLKVLFRRGYQVFTAGSGAAALEIVAREAIDVIVSDQRMPGMDGVELLREVKTRSPRTVRILLTGYSDNRAVKQSVNEGEVYRFLTKPWDNDHMRTTIAQAAGQARCASDEDCRRTVAPHPAPGARRQTAGILVLDDEVEVFQMARQAHAETDRIYHARNLKEGVAILCSNKIDVVVAETRVSGKSVTELLHVLKIKRPSIMAIIVSRWTDFNAMQQLINYVRVYRIFSKPCCLKKVF